MIQAKCVTLNAGHDDEKEEAQRKLELGRYYEVKAISMGGSYTNITLPHGNFNSVFFVFFEDDNHLNIYNDKRFNPYL